VLSSIVLTTAAVAFVLTGLGHRIAAAAVLVTTVVAGGYGLYVQLTGRQPRAEKSQAGLVVICHVRADLRWALWAEDRLSAAGFRARLQHIPPGQKASAISGWVELTITDATCVLVILSSHLTDADEGVIARLTALSGSRAAHDRVICVDTDGLSTLTAFAELPCVSIAGVHRHDVAWQLLDYALRERGVQSDPGRAATFGELSVPYPGLGVLNASLPRANPNFVGRTEELDRLKKDLVDARGDVTVRSVSIHAMSGMGKTQLAARFATELREEIDTVWWVHAHQPATIYADLTSLAQKLGLADVADQNEMLRQLWERLRTRDGHWLLIYDNAESEETLADLVPTAGNGSLLITSQSPNWSTLHRRIELRHMSAEDSVKLLLRRVPVRDKTVLAQIAELLGWLPLALEQAASYMRETQRTPSWYLDQLTKRFSETLERGSQAYYDKSAATTYRLAREQTTSTEPLSGVLLELCGFLSPDTIPRDLFEDPAQAGALPRKLAQALAAALPYDAAVSAARKFSLLGVTPQSFTMHRVVQQLIRDSLTPQLRDERVNTVVRLLSRAFPQDPIDAQTWETCGALQSHCVTALAEVDRHDLVSPDSIRLGRLVGEYQRVRGAFDPALKRLMKTLTQLRAHGGDAHELAATELALSRVHYQLANLPDADKHANEALRLHETTFGPDDHRTAATLLELSKIQIELTEFAAAQRNAARALAVNRAANGRSADLIGQSLEMLGIIQWRVGAFDEAEANLEQAVILLEQALGVQNSVTARARTCWSLVLRDEAGTDVTALERAEEQFELAYAVLKQTQGPDHPDTCSAAIHWADTRHRRARAEYLDGGAIDHCEDAYRQIAAEFAQIMQRPPLRAQRPGRACGLVRQGHLLNDTGDHEAAGKLVTEAHGIYMQSYGADHPYVAEALTRLTQIEYSLGHETKSRQHAEEAKRIYREKCGAGHPYIKQIDDFLADPGTYGI
jgi:tetratricopeptide (TPR) repeat protein